MMEGFTRSLPSSPLLHLRLAKRAGTVPLVLSACLPRLASSCLVLSCLVCLTGCHMVMTACSKPNTGKHAFAQFQTRHRRRVTQTGSQMAVSRRRQRGRREQNKQTLAASQHTYVLFVCFMCSDFRVSNQPERPFLPSLFLPDMARQGRRSR